MTRIQMSCLMIVTTLSLYAMAFFVFNGNDDGRFFTVFWKAANASLGASLGLWFDYFVMRDRVLADSHPQRKFTRAFFIVGFAYVVAIGG